MTLTDAINTMMSLGEVPEDIGPKVAAALEKKFGSMIGRHLGGGSKGFAWMIGKDLVLKITTDEQEAHAASTLVGQHHPNVGYYKHVARIGNLDIYAIIQEYAGEPIKDFNIRKAIDKLPDRPEEIIATLKELVETSSHPMWAQLLSGMQWIRDNGINFFDLHSDNVVQRGEIYKIIDVGVGNPETMHLANINLERKLHLALGNMELIPL